MSTIQSSVVVALFLSAAMVRGQDDSPKPFHKLYPKDQQKFVEQFKEGNLLPKAPKREQKPWRPIYSLDDVPELVLDDALFDCDTDEKAADRVSLVLEKFRRLDRERPNGFIQAIQKNRPDLAGLPFALGRDADMKPDLFKNFTEMNRIAGALFRFADAERPAPQNFVEPDPKPLVKPRNNGWELRTDSEYEALAHLARQKLFHLGEDGRLAVVLRLQSLPSISVNRVLAEIALFAPEPLVRKAAIASLKVRRKREIADVLIRGLTYPLPAVNENAAQALVELAIDDYKSFEEVANLVKDEGQRPYQGKDGKLRVQEVVKVNHNRNCALCHPPTVRGTIESETDEFRQLMAYVPNPRENLPESFVIEKHVFYHYVPTAAVRFDVTYLRPDFSLTLPDTDAARATGWPKEQRFDFLVRERILQPSEVAAYEKAKAFLPPSPSAQAAQRVLKALTGRDDVPPDNHHAWYKAIRDFTDARDARRSFLYKQYREDTIE